MPDGNAGSFAAIDGNEFVNAQRTIAYINNFGLPITVSEDCWCPGIQELVAADCDEPPPIDGYQFPSTDPAPWYDAAVPESGDFLGFLPLSFEGLGSTFTRQTFETLNNGAVLGRLRAQARPLTWRGMLFGRTCCAAEYGLRWLTAQLSSAGGCDGCDGSELDILICCPETDPQTNQNACGNTQTEVDACATPGADNIGMAPPLGASVADDAFRTLYRAGLIAGPAVVSRRTVGCGGDCEYGPGCMIEVEFTLIAGNPYLHRRTQLVCEETFPDCDDACDPADPQWVKVDTTAFPANEADGAKCLDSLDCSVLDSSVNCIADPDCPTATLPKVPDFEDPCGCAPLFSSSVCCEISNDIYGQFFEGVPTISIFSGTDPNIPLRNVQVDFYENPQERTCDDTQLFQSDCFKCASVLIRYIPGATTIKVDGLTRRIEAECIGRDPIPAESLTVSPFNWPVLKCLNYIIRVSADCAFPIQDNARVTVCVTPREM